MEITQSPSWGASSIKKDSSRQEILGSPQNIMRQYIRSIEMERSPQNEKASYKMT